MSKEDAATGMPTLQAERRVIGTRRNRAYLRGTGGDEKPLQAMEGGARAGKTFPVSGNLDLAARRPALQPPGIPGKVAPPVARGLLNPLSRDLAIHARFGGER
jgi:hypothetical protein